MEMQEILQLPDYSKARSLLKKAIALHEAHMEGREPTTGEAGRKSQSKMMDMMVGALSAMGKQ